MTALVMGYAGAGLGPEGCSKIKYPDPSSWRLFNESTLVERNTAEPKIP
jgi:hypothetical protein